MVLGGPCSPLDPALGLEIRLDLGLPFDGGVAGGEHFVSVWRDAGDEG